MTGRLLTAARWPVGVTLTAWSYMWRTTVLYRRELPGTWPGDGPPAVEAAVDMSGVQRPEDGAGPLFRRRYSARFTDARESATALIDAIKADPNIVAPNRLAKFEKTSGAEGELRVGDEFVVRMPGPWNGPIRVVEVTPTSFRFVTLDGHLEAGQIEWRASDDGGLQFEIESWSRAGDRASHLMHDKLRMAKEVQLYMWSSVLERIPEVAGGRLEGGIEIETRRAEVP